MQLGSRHKNTIRMKNKRNLIGKKFGRLEVLEEAEKRGKRIYWLCKCDCGVIKEICGEKLTSGNTISCGCYNREKNTKHGRSKERIYTIWNNMKQRCYNKKHIAYIRYGGKGVTVCEEWLNNIENFIEWAENSGYKENLTLDRIDNSKGYSPDNCRWATRKEQAVNRKTSKLYEYKGEIHTLNEWSKILKIPQSTLWYRANKTNNKDEIFKGGDNFDGEKR